VTDSDAETDGSTHDEMLFDLDNGDDSGDVGVVDSSAVDENGDDDEMLFGEEGDRLISQHTACMRRTTVLGGYKSVCVKLNFLALGGCSLLLLL
jgi:hypothetical protein